MENLHPIVLVWIATAFAVGYLVWRGSGRLVHSFFASGLALLAVTMVPVMMFGVVARRYDLPMAVSDEWALTILMSGNVIIWVAVAVLYFRQGRERRDPTSGSPRP